MVIEIKEFDFKGIRLQLVEGKGWKFAIGGQEYLFPNCQEAKCAIAGINKAIQPVIEKHKGVKL